jgi:hypothetical protein
MLLGRSDLCHDDTTTITEVTHKTFHLESRMTERNETVRECRKSLHLLRVRLPRQAKTVAARILTREVEAGSELGNLFPRLPRDWWPMLEDVFRSPQARVGNRKLRSSHVVIHIVQERYAVMRVAAHLFFFARMSHHSCVVQTH